MQSTILDPNDCARHGIVHCPSAGKLLASMYNFKGAINVPYSQVWKFTFSNDCSGGYGLGSVVSFYNDWVNKLPANSRMVTDFRDTVTKQPECRLAFCRALDFSGNADFAGVGVIVSFGIQLCIATFFALFCLCCLFRPDTTGIKWKAFRNTFHAFFVSSVYFNVAICVAATATIALENKTQHTAVFTTLGLLLSLSSTQTLWPLHRTHVKTEKELCNTCEPVSITVTSEKLNSVIQYVTNTRLIKFCLAVLWIVILALCAVIIDVSWESNFELFCFHHLAARPFAEKLLLAPIGLVAFGLILSVLKQILKYRLTEKVVEQYWIWVERATVIAGIVLMWFVFGTLWILRAQVGNIAGEGYQDNNWGFGQIAAVATWLPTLVIIIQDIFGLMAKGNRSTSTSQPQLGDGQMPSSGDDESSAGDGSRRESFPPKTVSVVQQDAVSGV